MSNFDDYFRGDDKPFAENLNDALLLSNVFDFTVPIELPTMFSNGQWVNTTSSRKCSVSLVAIEDLDGLSVTGANVQGTGELILKFYPNFNSFGKISKLEWTGDVTSCWITDKNNVTVEAEVENGVVLSGNANQLAEYLIHLEIDGALTGLVVTCENKRHRFGATVGVSGVTGLESRLSSIEVKNTQQDININNKVDKVTGKQLSSNDYSDGEKSKLANLSSVAVTGSYNDLSNKPSIPSKTSDLENDGDGTNVFVKNNDSRLSDTRNPKTHTHGNISNTGAIGTSSGKLITTGTNGVLQAVDSITKSKISDFPTSMTPTSHTHTISNVTNLQSSLDSKASSGHSHGSISNTGTLNSDIISVNKVAVTDTNNALKTINKLPFEKLDITKSNITGLGIPSTNTTYSVATANANGLMSSTDKSKLDGIATGATKNTIDTALSSTSTNAVQNKVVNTALSGKANSSHTHGNISNDGKIGSTENKPLITTTNGQITTGAFGTTANTFAEGNHSHNSWQEVTLSNQYASLYVNMDLRLAELKYYQTNVSFTSTADKTVASNIIPTEYRPVGTGVPVVIFNPKLGGNIDSVSGNFNVATTETGNKTVNAYGIWRF